MKSLRRILVLLILIGILNVQNTFAQTTLDVNDISIEVTPEVPGPSEPVHIELVSYSIAIDEYYIEWYEKDSLSLAGFGEKRFDFTTGSLNETSVVEVRIKESQAGKVIFSKKIVAKPAGIDLLWQAVDSYVPPFYKGKALPTTEGLIKITALPTFRIGTKTVSPKNAVYQWKRNFESIPEGSGYGKNTIILKQSYLNDEEKISVSATETTEGGTAKAIISFKPYTPKIVFYEKDPSLGTRFNQGIVENTTVSRIDKTLVAAPFFVSAKDPTDFDLSYTWSLNGSELATPTTPNQIVLRGTDQPGTATLKLALESVSKLFLSATKEIKLNLE